MHYIDGYVLPIPKKNLRAYQKTALQAGKIWKEHGALEYRECVGDDFKVPMVLSFLKGVRAKPGETIIFSYIVFKSRAHRDKVNKKVIGDPRLQELMKEDSAFEMKRMLYSGFQTIVEL